MSFWDKYLAPGDLRRQQQHLPPPSQDELPETRPQQPPPPPRIDAAHRARRQSALLYGGLTFTALSLFITRRALRRKQLQALPQAPSATLSPAGTPPPPPPKVDGGLEAIEALGLATLNVFSIAMATAGGLMTWFDIADIEDLRDGVRRGVGFDVYGGDSEADKELEGWVADILSRKDGTGDLQTGIIEKLKEIEEKEKRQKRLEKEVKELSSEDKKVLLMTRQS